MKKAGFLIVVFQLCLCLNGMAQPGTWTWMKGDSAVNGSAVYGVQGMPSPLNVPPAVYEPAEFTDQQGNFWLFGGLSSSQEHNDLWKYAPLTNQWTWVKGSGWAPAQANFGIQGVPSASNMPPGLSWGTASWVDNNGDFWIYGGAGNGGPKNNLWKYNISTNTWTWVKGSGLSGQNAIYGIQGVSNVANTPGDRYECCASWVDNNNNLWLFGGASGLGDLNDLWKYDPAINEWTWMKGANFTGQPGVYGTKGISNTSNVPGARSVYCHWKDNQGNFWFFGGTGIYSGFNFNDLWKYEPSSNNWTWMSGTNLVGDTGTFGIPCVPSINNIPPARFENRSFWTDANHNFWLYGGYKDLNGSELYGDLWLFIPSTLEWVFVSGATQSNQTAIYGSLGIPSGNNSPGGHGGSISWFDNAGHLFLSSGRNIYGDLNELWRYEIDPGCPFIQLPPAVNFFSSDTTFCDKKFINFTDISTNNPTSWQWLFPGAIPASDTNQNPVNIYYPSFGSFDVTLIACNSIGCDTLHLPNFIREYQPPAVPLITSNFDTLFSTPAYAYQWYNSSGLIPGATNSFYVYLQQGSYYVVVTDSNGCATSSNVIGTAIGQLNFEIQGVMVTPNPSNGFFEITYRGIDFPIEIEISDMTGRIICHSTSITVETSINIDFAADGIYLIKIATGKSILNRKIVVNHCVK